MLSPALVLSLLAVFVQSCPDSTWLPYGNDCFRIVDNDTENPGGKFGFNEAEAACVARAGHLASIHSNAEMNALNAIIDDRSPMIGLQCFPDPKLSVVCSNIDGSKYDYDRFEGGYPQLQNGNCVHLHTDDKYWSWHCDWSMEAAICKITNYTPSCAAGWTLHGRRCMRVYEHATSFENAERQCGMDGGHLASIHDEQENNFVLSLALATGENALIGLEESPNGPGVLAESWTDGTAVDFHNWAAGSPSGNRHAPSCAQFRVTGGSAGRWESVECDAALPFICAKPAL